jgi:hypothetical protein
LNIGELYDSLEWTSDDALNKWLHRNLPEQVEWAEKERGSEYNRVGRCWMLAYALPTEIAGDLPEFSEEVQQDARRTLQMAGVWGQVCDYLVENDYLDAPKNIEVKQLALFHENRQLTHGGTPENEQSDESD